MKQAIRVSPVQLVALVVLAAGCGGRPGADDPPSRSDAGADARVADAAPADARVADAAPADARVADAAPADASPVMADCRPARPHDSRGTLTAHTLQSSGVERTYALYVPESYDGTEAVPVVFDFHAAGVTPQITLAIDHADAAAEDEGFLVVLPLGVEERADGRTTWAVPPAAGKADDIRFTADVLADIERRLCVDTGKVYAMGYSDGARMASQVACELSDRFAAISAVGGIRLPEGACTGARPIPILAFHSLDDPVNHFEVQADSPGYWTYGVEVALGRWAASNGCDATPAEEQLASTVSKMTYEECDASSAVTFYCIAHDGHTWPGSDFDFMAIAPNLGTTNQDIDATDLSVAFFEQHEVPAAP